MLSVRLKSVFVLIPIVITFLFISSVKQFSVCIFIICLMGAWEWSRIMRFSVSIHHLWMSVLFLLLCIILKIMVFQDDLCLSYWYIFKYIANLIILWWIIILWMILFYPNSAFFWKKSNILRFLFGMLMLLPFFWGTLMLRQFFYINNILGKWWVFYLLILIWSNDSSAYFIGKIFGKNKFCKKISPGKTWEGCIGGILISVGVIWILNVCNFIVVIDNQYCITLICYMIAVLSAVVGDLSASMFKRESGIKDSGYLIPGHGGILDRIDSFIAAVPIFVSLILLLVF